jgi:NSS family neurotransmitter:Na+ symporter
VPDNTKPAIWSSRSTFILACIGAAVGLGNLWRFPFEAGKNGGSAFVLIYLLFIFFLCIPIIMAELAIGRRGHSNPVKAMHNLTRSEKLNRGWHIIGWFSIVTPFIAISFYSVVAGWTIEYAYQAIIGGFTNFDSVTSQQSFNTLLISPARMLLLHTLFLGTAVFIVSRGLIKGIEWIAKLVMPLLFTLLLIMVVNAVLNGDIERGLAFLFKPDFSKITPRVAFLALGQAFFSVSVGVGALLTYGSYMPEGISIPKSALIIGLVDTMVALLAGIAIFPMVFAYGLNPASGPGLIFVTLPVAFGQMIGGPFLGALFFALMYLAAFSTVVAMLEPVVSWLVEKRRLGRPMITVATGFCAWLLGVAALFSFNIWKDVNLLGFLPFVADKNIFDLFDFVVSNLFIPVNGLLIALFAGWAMPHHSIIKELNLHNRYYISYWIFAMRYLAPIAILLLFIQGLN